MFNSSNANEIELAQLSEGFNAQQKYMASCFACHSTGAAGAPKVGAGMSAEWEPRLEKGLDAVVQNAINGISDTKNSRIPVPSYENTNNLFFFTKFCNFVVFHPETRGV